MVAAEEGGMKIITWDEMVKMPPGTIYQHYSPHELGDLKVLGSADQYRDNLVCADLLPQTMGGYNYSDQDRRRLGIGENDYLIQTPSGHGRDDYYDDKAKYRFLVWDEDDKRRLARWLTMDPAAMAKEMNDDNPTILVVDEEHQIAPTY
jgi:hypothetical protein